MQFTRLMTLLVTGFCLLSIYSHPTPLPQHDPWGATRGTRQNAAGRPSRSQQYLAQGQRQNRFQGNAGRGEVPRRGREEAMKLEPKTREDKANESLWAIHATRPVWEDDR
ncbi:MAG: hypothetical protein M1821_001866 [Bathelium mastoideum]|nr:MAG: hypothetical protein M1821_001866 [Bathelium mastoideum]